jgi:hypothetical protein
VSSVFDLVACDSKSELEEQLRSAPRSLHVGADAQSPRGFYILTITRGNPLVVGLSLSRPETKPGVVASRNGERLLIGHDRAVTSIDAPSGRTKATRVLDGVFFQFLEPTEENVVVIHELGALQIGFDGTIGWTAPSTDVVENFRVYSGRILELSIANAQAPLRISLADGRPQS